MRIALVSNAPPTSGTGKPARLLGELLRRYNQALTVDEFMIEAHKGVALKNGVVVVRQRLRFPWKPIAWLRLGRALDVRAYDVVHYTNQTLAFLAGSSQVPAVVTVWDLIERLEPQERGGGLAARVLYRGIPRAARVIAVSLATAEDLQRLYRIPDERLRVIPPALPETFRYFPNIWETAGGKAFLERQKLKAFEPIILYVGSEHRRKNLPRLLEAVARVRRSVKNLRFVKIGPPGLAQGRVEFLSSVERLSLSPALRLVEEARDDELVYWYHAATVLAFPTLMEGFGFPPLEAMACGTPVVTAQRSSLPEVVGDAAVLVNPESVSSITEGLRMVLTNPTLRAELRDRGLARAAAFSPEVSLRSTVAVYAEAIAERYG